MEESPIDSESELEGQEIKKDKSVLYTGLVLGAIVLIMAYLALFVDDVNSLFSKKVNLETPASSSSAQIDESMDDSEVRRSLTKFIQSFYYDQQRGYFDPPSYFANITETYYNYHNLTHQRLRDLHQKRLSEMRDLQQNWIVSSLDFERDGQRMIATYWVRVNYFQALKNANESADVKLEMIINQDGKISSLKEIEVKNFSSVVAEPPVNDSVEAEDYYDDMLMS